MTSPPPGRSQSILLVAVIALVALAGVLAAFGYGREPATDMLTVERNGYLHGVRHADRHMADPAAAWPRDELGVAAACRSYLDAEVRGFDRDAFLAGCHDAAELPR